MHLQENKASYSLSVDSAKRRCSINALRLPTLDRRAHLFLRVRLAVQLLAAGEEFLLKHSRAFFNSVGLA